ncbi:DUF1360 domain-containing protein [Streptomyces sp. 1222.2]|uniref:DUF1360 domain-containing protein n=1 Tax=Streptomyces sp. 1222.2 TaxID=1938833 RepID=UPI003F9062E8
MLSKAAVTSPLRAPFTRYVGPQGPAELHEEARTGGAKDTVGELVTRPCCMSVWVDSTLTVGGLLWPRATAPRWAHSRPWRARTPCNWRTAR